jgi:hypothetical protein
MVFEDHRKAARETLESALEQHVEVSIENLSEDQRAQLSKVLFPETHTDKITVLGQERQLRPTPIKVSRKIDDLLSPLIDKIEAAEKSAEDVDVGEDMLAVLFEVVAYLADFYEWEDVATAAREENLSHVELERVAVGQQNLNGRNDFLLQGLRIVIKTLQANDILVLLLEESMMSSITLRSLKDGISASTN